MPSSIPTSSFDRPWAISSTTWRCRSVMPEGFRSACMRARLRLDSVGRYRPKGVSAMSSSSAAGLRGEHRNHVANGVGALAERVLLRSVEVDLEDLLDPLGAELHGHAHVEAIDAVLAFEER